MVSSIYIKYVCKPVCSARFTDHGVFSKAKKNSISVSEVAGTVMGCIDYLMMIY